MGAAVVWDTTAEGCQIFWEYLDKNIDNLYRFCKNRFRGIELEVKLNIPALVV